MLKQGGVATQGGSSGPLRTARGLPGISPELAAAGLLGTLASRSTGALRQGSQSRVEEVASFVVSWLQR